MRRTLPALLAGLALLACPVDASAEWMRMSSEHFLFVGDASERQMRGMAERLERFHAVVGRVLGSAATGSPVPTVVLAFRNDKSFTPFKPVFDGRPVAVAGYFVGSDDVNYVAVNAEQDASAYGVVFHEFAHALLGRAVVNPPAWLDEGLAEFYETFESRDEGKVAIIGSPNRDDLERLRSAPLLPLAQLLAVDRDSPLYNEGSRRSTFYAQSWALVHYLTFGSPERAAQLSQYLVALNQAVPAMEAFRQTFGADTSALEQELRRYIGQGRLSAVRVAFEAPAPATVAGTGEAISDGDAAAYLGDAMARLGRTTDARAYLRAAIAADPQAGRAMAALGLLEIQDGNDAVALPLLERAASLAAGDASVQSAYGRALVRRAEGGGPEEDALYARAGEVLTRALELDPSSVPTSVMLAALDLSRGADPGRAVTLMRGVVRAMPGRENYRLMLARALAAQGDFESATALLGPLVARGSRPEMREAAREVLAHVADATAGRCGSRVR